MKESIYIADQRLSITGGFQRGFTLIELSIVLVIIGLVVGGVLVGRDLIKAAELRKVVSEIESFQSAITTFKGKYRYYPGDCPNAEAIWGSDASCPNTPDNTVPKAQTCNGNGDGQVANMADITLRYERLRSWQHLANAGLIAGNFTGADAPVGGVANPVYGINAPRSAYSQSGWQFEYFGVWTGGGVWFANRDHGHAFILGGDSTLANQFTVDSQDAYRLDSKIDDGRPAYGKVVPTRRAPECISNATNSAIYNFAIVRGYCRLMIDSKL
jgi:prepilin-type N-terminal cleavage/methylation domain-containing protein